MTAFVHPRLSLKAEIDSVLEASKPKKARKPKASESAIQQAIKQRLIFHGIVAVHVPNAGRRSVISGFKLKQEGMMPGFPDLICLGDAGRIGFLEVKTDTGRLSEAQERCHDMLRRKGHLVAVVRSQDDAVAVLQGAGWL
jgi:hypothetical protein